MTKYENNKRVCSRAITFIEDSVLLIKRHNEKYEIKDYYTIPGGGVEDNEEYSEAAVREVLEETCCNVEIVSFLEKEDYRMGICYWFYSKYIDGEPTLGGEELERNNKDNYYEVQLINMKDIDNIFIFGRGKSLIKECYKEYKKEKKK